MSRKTILLDTDWMYVRSALTADEAARAEGEAVTLPHTWNAIDGQDGGNDYYRGTCWYIRRLQSPKLEQGERAYLEFDGAAMTAEVYLNGEKLARHEGGYAAFRVDITDCVKEENVLAVSVDNSSNDRVYPQSADFTFYGGLYRDVKLIVVPEAHFAMDYCGTKGIKVTPKVTLRENTKEEAAGHGRTADARKGDAVVTVEVWVSGPAENVKLTVAGQTKNAVLEDGYGKAEFAIADVHLWDGVNDPYLYIARAELESGDAIETRFGCRNFAIDPQTGFLLNGRSYPLRGVSRHQDRKGVGNALTVEMHREDMKTVKEIGANTLRLAHYQHAQEFYDLCDEEGIIVWAEIPYITMHMKNGRENTLSQMEELIVQNYNHPCIVVWGLSNEITAASAVDGDLLENHRLLNDLCHRLDVTRLTTMANVFMLETDSPILEIPDVNSYNLYFGWYLGELEQNDQFFDEYHAKYPDRCIGFSEYGADANPQYQAMNPECGDYTESYQTVYHEHILGMIEDRPWLWATYVWNLFDFAADGRDEGGKHGENQKGLVTFDRKMKKDAFYLYKAHWNKKDAFVHICGSRRADRTEEITEIKVYSNQPEITLLVDGKEFETKQGNCLFRFMVPIHGEHRIEARIAAGKAADSLTPGSNGGRDAAVRDAGQPAEGGVTEIFVRRVQGENADYIYNKQGDVVNWFDKEDFNPDCYSVSDTMAELAQNQEANALVQKLMANAVAARGDVADSVKDNPALQRMMGRMTLQSLLKQAGEAVSAEQIQALNSALQKIKKTKA